LENLQELDISRNQLIEINENTFNGLKNLQHLDLSENRLKEMDKNILENSLINICIYF
jgi:Leucine-rich repeat (LRR) protein